MASQASGGKPAVRRDEVLDASVLCQQPIRGLLLWIAAAGLFEPTWSEHILEETRRNLVGKKAMTAEQWERLRKAMVGGFPDAMVPVDDIAAIEDQMPNQEKDRHVLAAAVAGNAPRVVTNNLKDFKARDVAKVGKQSISADDVLCEFLDRSATIVRGALTQQAATMRKPRQWTVPELLGRLAGLGKGDPLAHRFAAAAQERYGIQPVPPPSPDDP
jgi:hypothetical protein